MAPAQGRENVAVFNPIVLALPNWHPDGPDGDVDGYVVPFVFPDVRESGRQPNRNARLRIYPDAHGWRAALRNCQDHAETSDQARAFAAAWIRAAEVLEAVEGRAQEAEREAERAARDKIVEHVNGAAPIAGKRDDCPACQHGSCTLHSGEVKPS